MKDHSILAGRAFLLLIHILFARGVSASTYYFSSSQGNDSRTAAQAQKAATPWKTLQKLQELFPTLKPGDSILFKRGDVFDGFIDVMASGSATAPIVLATYGQGNKPVINGFSALTGWKNTGNNIHEAVVPTSYPMVNFVLVNDHPENIGRYPNISENNGGYLSIDSVPSATSIAGPALPAATWNGAEVVIRKNHWVVDRNRITGVSGKTIQFVSESNYKPVKQYGYFVQNHRATLDLPLEWYFDSASKKLGMYFGQAPGSARIQASTIDRLLIIKQKNYIAVQGLTFKGANGYAIDLQQCKYIRLTDCTIQYSGNTAVHTLYGDNLTIDSCLIQYSNNNACDIFFTNSVIVKNSTILETGTVAGSGRGNSGSYEALLLAGDQQQITGNTITNTGYIPITFNGNNITISRNVIRAYGFIKDDGGGIYTWNNGPNAPVRHNRVITDNLVFDGLGAPEGTADRRGATNGIYIDDNADHVNIARNVVARCSLYGLYVHNGHDLVIDSNIFFDSYAQAALIHDAIAEKSAVTNVTFTRNNCFSRTATQRVALFRTIDADLSQIGVLDNNYYCRPLDEQSPIYASWKTGFDYYDLEGWQQFMKQDLRSQKTSSTIAPYTILTLGANKYSNGNLSANKNGLYVFTTGNAITSSWVATSPLDTGALKIAWTGGLSGNKKHASVIVDIGRLDSAKHYLWRYDEAGVTTRYIESYLRKSLTPYTDLSSRIESRVNAPRSRTEVLFRPTATEPNASVGLDITEQTNPVHIDNIRLHEATVYMTNPDDSIKFLYNNTNKTQTYSLDGQYKDVSSKVYNGTITLPALRAAVLVKQKMATTMALLPLTYLAFAAVQQEDDALLRWTVTDGAAGSIQEVQRSADGKKFVKIGAVTALSKAGTEEYTYIDHDAGRTNYYRIRYVNATGQVAYSKVVSLPFSKNDRSEADEKRLFRIIPNPATSQIQIIIDKSIFNKGTIQLKTMQGGVVKTIALQQPSFVIDISFLSRGMYALTALMNNQSISRRFVKL